MPSYNIVVFAGDYCGPEVSSSLPMGRLSGAWRAVSNVLYFTGHHRGTQGIYSALIRVQLTDAKLEAYVSDS
jgi:hypothetical protein